METRLQAFSGRCPICAPSEGEWKMRESASPSEGGRSMLEMETRLQAFSKRGYRRSRGGAPSAHLRKVRLKCGETTHLRKVGRSMEAGREE